MNDSGTGGGTGGNGGSAAVTLLEMEDCDKCLILTVRFFVGDGDGDETFPFNFNCAEYSYDGGDCNSSGGGTDTGGSTDTGGGTSSGEFTCNNSSFSAATANATNANDAVVYSALSASATPANYFAIEVFQSTFGGPTATELIRLSASDNYADCGPAFSIRPIVT